MVRKHIGFWTKKTIRDQKFVEWLDQMGINNYGDWARKTLFDVFDKKLITPTSEDLKNEKIKIDIEFKKVMIDIKKKELMYWQIFKSSPSYQGKRSIKIGVENQFQSTDSTDSPSCFDEKNHQFICPECQLKFVFREDFSDIAQAKEQFIDHYFQKYGDMPKKLERELLESN